MTLLTASMPPPPHCNLHIAVARILLIVFIVLRYQYIDSAGTIAVCSRPEIGIAANTPSALRPTSLGGPIICPWSVSYNAPLGPPPFSYYSVFAIPICYVLLLSHSILSLLGHLNILGLAQLQCLQCAPHHISQSLPLAQDSAGR